MLTWSSSRMTDWSIVWYALVRYEDQSTWSSRWKTIGTVKKNGKKYECTFVETNSTTSTKRLYEGKQWVERLHLLTS